MAAPDPPSPSDPPETPSEWQFGPVADHHDEHRSVRYEAEGNATTFTGPRGVIGYVQGPGPRVRVRKRWNTLRPGTVNVGLLVGLGLAGIGLLVGLVVVLLTVL